MKFKLVQKPKLNRFSKKYRGEKCLNCETNLALTNRYCPNCGQKNSTKKLSFWDLIQEIFNSVVSYDSKLWISIKALVANPGKLTTNYLAGKRARYVNPFRFFLSLAILFFLINSLITNNEDYDEIVEVLDEINFYEVNQENEQAETKQVTPFTQNPDSLQYQNNYAVKKDSVYDDLNLIQKLILNFENKKQYKFENAIEENLLENTFFDRLTFRFIRGITKLKNNFTDYLSFLRAKIPFFMFLFIPLFTWLNFIMFWKAKRTYLDHLVFNFNMSSIFILIYGLEKLIGSLISSKIALLLFFLLILFYVFRSLIFFYSSNKLSSIFKSLVYVFLYSSTLSVFLVVSMLISLMFY